MKLYPEIHYLTSSEQYIKGHILEVLMSMYSNDKSAVKIENKINQTFPCHNGVKQGCMLSPTLFNIYLSDLPEMLNRGSELCVYVCVCGGGGGGVGKGVVYMSVVS